MPSTSLKAQTFRKLRFRFCSHIVNMNGSSLDHGATGDGSTADNKTLLTAHPEHWSIMRGTIKHLPVNAEDNGIVCAAYTGSVLGNYVQDGLYIGRRAGDHAEDLACRRLLLQRFSELSEQPHVLDGDDRLIGEGLEEFDLRRSKGMGEHAAS